MTISGAPTSYFSTPAPELDPTLFEGRRLRSWVRQGVSAILTGSLGREFRHPETWSHAWLAGSGVSYQWQAAREPGDLDCLVGVDFVKFRKANPEYQGLNDKEVAEEINEFFRQEVMPTTENWNGFELTFYVNPSATDIRTINPYAAYDLKYDEWTVSPNPVQQPPVRPEWDSVAVSDYSIAHQAHTRATKALQDIGMTHAGPARRNAEAQLNAAISQADTLYTTIHGGRSEAFSPSGEGYNDFYNYRWQAAKRSGAIDLLRHIRTVASDMREQHVQELYGVDLPDTDTLIRRAALYRSTN